jgi:deoxyribodipyrimidine photo-lyase
VSTGLVLFTRDLRLGDNPALAAASRDCDAVLPAFVLDRELLRRAGSPPNRLAFLLESLRDLRASLRARGAPLIIREGDVVQEAIRLVHECRLSAIYMSADYTPYAGDRLRRLRRSCEREQIRLRTFGGVTVCAPGSLTPAGADHYRVFTPYWNAWRSLPRRPAARLPARLSVAGPQPAAGPLPKLSRLTSKSPSSERQRGGEREGRAQLARWLRTGPELYTNGRDELGAEHTSRLSPYLHFGCLSAASVLERLDGHGDSEAFARQLCWRDFHHQVLFARPDMPHADYRPRGDRWRRSGAEAQAWREGRTGYPIVDAGMRQLKQEGYMHNRARLIVGSFLTKTLYLDWRLGAAHFASLLLDADIANNVGNWQWVAGTGNDTRPNRVLNPLRQAYRYDPDGTYVRRYVPELAAVAGAAIHEPWLLDPGARRRLRYPEPIVDLARAAEEFRARRGR